jgi:hypothetical protein
VAVKLGGRRLVEIADQALQKKLKPFGPFLEFGDNENTQNYAREKNNRGNNKRRYRGGVDFQPKEIDLFGLHGVANPVGYAFAEGFLILLAEKVREFTRNHWQHNALPMATI